MQEVRQTNSSVGVGPYSYSGDCVAEDDLTAPEPQSAPPNSNLFSPAPERRSLTEDHSRGRQVIR